MDEQGIKHGTSMREGIRNFIIEYAAEHGYPPSFKEIGTSVGLRSKGSVYSHMKRMRDDGMIDYIDYAPRTITVPGYGFKKL